MGVESNNKEYNESNSHKERNNKSVTTKTEEV